MTTRTAVPKQTSNSGVYKRDFSAPYSTNDGTRYEFTQYGTTIINSSKQANDIAQSRKGTLIAWNEVEKEELTHWVNFRLKEGEWTYIADKNVNGKPKARCIKKHIGKIVQTDKIPNYPTTKVFIKLSQEETQRRDHARLLRDYADEEAFG